MAILSTTEQQQNKEFLNTLFRENFSHINFSETVKLMFLEKCKKEAIWLLGLSPLVQKTFIQALTLALQDTRHDAVYKLNCVFQALCAKLKEENEYLKWQFTQSSKYNSQPRTTIAQYLADNRAVPADYWLQTDDMINALEPLAAHTEIYIHPPVTKVDASVTACVDAALKTNSAKVAYVTVESGGHWTLEIYKIQNNNLVKRHYNPPGDGKCGDHVVNEIIADAQKTLQKNFGHNEAAPAKNSHEVRQQTIQSIQNNQPTIAAAIAPVTKNKTDFSELDKLYHQWNALANHVIDELAQYPAAKRAELWNNFFSDAAHSIKNRTWNPELFQAHSCASEATEIAKTMPRPLFVS